MKEEGVKNREGTSKRERGELAFPSLLSFLPISTCLHPTLLPPLNSGSPPRRSYQELTFQAE